LVGDRFLSLSGPGGPLSQLKTLLKRLTGTLNVEENRGVHENAGPAAPRRKKLGAVCILPVLVLLCCIAVRISLLSTPLTGEEGCFAWLAVENGHEKIEDAEKSILLARLDGKPILSKTNHPIVPYAFLALAVRPLSRLLPFDSLSYDLKSVVGRLPFLCLSSVGLLFLFAAGGWVFRLDRPIELLFPLTLIAFAATSPMLVAGAIQPQVDGSWGVMLVATSAFCLCAAGRSAALRSRFWLAFVAGIIAAMGKNEWAIAFLAAAAAGWFIAARIGTSLQSHEKHSLLPNGPLFAGMISGVLSGSVISLWVAPDCYLGGFDVMRRFSLHPQLAWPEATLLRLPKIWPGLLLLLLSGWILLPNLRPLVRQNASLISLFLWGLFLMAGFLATSWSADDRYFCPGLFALLCFAVVSLELVNLPRRLSNLLSLACIMGISFNLFALYHPWGRMKSRQRLTPVTHHTQYVDFRNTQKPVFTGTAFGYYYPDADFVSYSLGEEGAKRLLTQHGKTAQAAGSHR
jgi:hypothetical protein